MSNKSVPKLKTDFMLLYKGLYNSGHKKSPANTSNFVTSMHMKERYQGKTLEKSKDNRSSASRGQETSKSINSLFRSSGKVEGPKYEDAHLMTSAATNTGRTSQWHHEKREGVNPNIIFNQRTISKGSMSRGSSAGSKKRHPSQTDGLREARIKTAIMGIKPVTPGTKKAMGYKGITLHNNISGMGGKRDLKERDTSKPASRSSQRRTSTNTSPKSNVLGTHLGKDKLTKLLQPSTNSVKLVMNLDSHNLGKTSLATNTKRKNSSNLSITKKTGLEQRNSIAVKSSSKLISSSSHIGGFIKNKPSYESTKESISSKYHQLSRSKYRSTEDSSSSIKKPSSGLNNFITQVSRPTINKSGDSQVFKTLEKSSKTLKKKKKETEIVASPKQNLKNGGVFYMEKLELAFKKCSEDEESGLFRQHFKQTIQSLSLLVNVAKNVEPFDEKSLIYMPPLKNPKLKTIIFDLDETLIHCNEDQEAPCDARVPVSFPTGEFIEAGINIRPFAKVILKELSKYFEVVVFTASHACYANPVINYLDPEGDIVKKRLFRDNCRQVSEGLYVKDLTVLKNRDLKNVVLIDNAAYSYSLQLNNGIPIIPFYNSKKDTELRELAAFLISLADVDDVRPVLKEKFKNDLISENAKNMNLLFKKLFGI